MKKILGICLMMMSLAGHAQEGSSSSTGNGGAGVVCYNSREEIISVEMLDSFEHREIYRGYGRLGGPIPIPNHLNGPKAIEEYDRTIDKTKRYFARMKENLGGTYGERTNRRGELTPLGKFERFETLFWKKFDQIKRRIQRNYDGQELNLTNDIFPHISKRGCALKQLAIYLPNGSVLVASEYYYLLNGHNKAVLYLHETVYFMAREYQGATNSVESRLITGVLAGGSTGVESIRKVNAFVNTVSQRVPRY